MKPMPASRMQREIASGASSMRTPSAASTSAAPQREDSARLPCLATGTPAPATMKAAQVEMLNEPDASPPVRDLDRSEQAQHRPPFGFAQGLRQPEFLIQSQRRLP